jgi:hypothetical protein
MSPGVDGIITMGSTENRRIHSSAKLCILRMSSSFYGRNEAENAELAAVHKTPRPGRSLGWSRPVLPPCFHRQIQLSELNPFYFDIFVYRLRLTSLGFCDICESSMGDTAVSSVPSAISSVSFVYSMVEIQQTRKSLSRTLAERLDRWMPVLALVQGTQSSPGSLERIHFVSNFQQQALKHLKSGEFDALVRKSYSPILDPQ